MMIVTKKRRILITTMRPFQILALVISLTFAVHAQLPANLDCKCSAIGGDEYLCKCTASKAADGATAQVTPGKPAVTPAKLADGTTPATGTATKGTETPTGTATTNGQPIYTGPRGGQYHYSASGKKVYTRKK
jgi:PBCV-specific basic adaptor domain